MISLVRLFLVSASFVAVSLPAAAQATWVGKTIFIKQPGIKLRDNDDMGNQVVVGILDGIDYLVLADDGARIKVKDGRGAAGWFDKTDALLLENAVSHFTDRIRRNPQDAKVVA